MTTRILKSHFTERVFSLSRTTWCSLLATRGRASAAFERTSAVAGSDWWRRNPSRRCTPSRPSWSPSWSRSTCTKEQRKPSARTGIFVAECTSTIKWLQLPYRYSNIKQKFCKKKKQKQQQHGILAYLNISFRPINYLCDQCHVEFVSLSFGTFVVI